MASTGKRLVSKATNPLCTPSCREEEGAVMPYGSEGLVPFIGEENRCMSRLGPTGFTSTVWPTPGLIEVH